MKSENMLFWKTFNRLAKIVGYGFVFLGGYGFLRLAIAVFDPQLENMSAHTDSFYGSVPKEMRFVSLFLWAGIAAVGIALIKLKPMNSGNGKNSREG